MIKKLDGLPIVVKCDDGKYRVLVYNEKKKEIEVIPPLEPDQKKPANTPPNKE